MDAKPHAATPAGISELYNTTPSKIQPWAQATGGIPARAKSCGGGYVDSTHGVPAGGLLIMENAPKGLRLKENV